MFDPLIFRATTLWRKLRQSVFDLLFTHDETYGAVYEIGQTGRAGAVFTGTIMRGLLIWCGSLTGWDWRPPNSAAGWRLRRLVVPR